MKIYLASSWKNVELVRGWRHLLIVEGYDVDAFVDSSSGRYVFHFSEIGPSENLDAINFLKDERSKRAFKEDKKWLDWCDCCLLILPAGKSAHLEAGYAKGKGKKLIIWQDKFPKGEFDVMYGFADLITDSYFTVIDFLNSAYTDHNLSEAEPSNSDAVSLQDDVKNGAGGQGLEPSTTNNTHNKINKLD